MRLMTYNVNGIRAREEHIRGVLDMFEPDIVGLQETKIDDGAFPRAWFEDLGYHVAHYGQKGHYGVALLSKTPPIQVVKGFPGDSEDAQRRVIAGAYALAGGETLYVINGYFPQGEKRDHPIKFPAKEKFYRDLRRFLEQDYSPSDLLAVMGDMNVAPANIDVGIGDQNAKRWLRTGKSSFLPEEREWLGALFNWGLRDCFREMNPDAPDSYTWFDYRSRAFETEPKRGLRIDLLMATESLMARCDEAGVDYVFRGRVKPSDHCPVWADFRSK